MVANCKWRNSTSGEKIYKLQDEAITKSNVMPSAPPFLLGLNKSTSVAKRYCSVSCVAHPPFVSPPL